MSSNWANLHCITACSSQFLRPFRDVRYPILAALLERQGAAVVLDTDAGIDVYRQLLDRKVDVVTFTSASAVLGFLASVGADQASDLLAHTVVATLGPAAADAVTRANVTPAIQLPGGSLAAFADAIAAHFSTTAPEHLAR